MTLTLSPEETKALPHGVEILHNPHLNKGTAFTDTERDTLGLRGLLPPRVQSQQEQVNRVLANLRSKSDPLEKYIFLISLQDRNETLFYRVIIDHLEEMMPLIYTPTVGQACQSYGNIFRRPRGLYISAHDKGRVKEVLQNWETDDVRVIVVTDGERILGLGDLGANGMGIPVGKLSLYTACAGIDPRQCLPITLDMGTNNETLLHDPLYIGIQEKRRKGAEFDEIFEEFIAATQEVFPKAMVQLEDFGNHNAFRLLHNWRDRICTFDDDIQGTASVTLAGIYSGLRVTGGKLSEQVFVFLGAGEAGIGIADLIVSGMVDEGMDADEARKRCWFLDSKGLVVASRTDLVSHKLPYAHDHPFTADLLTAVEDLKPTVLIGASGQPATFTQPVVEAMARLNQRPMIFALSNPTSKSECTAEQAYRWTDGRGIYASGSPFPTVNYAGQTFVPGQANNSYIFPGVGLGVVASGSTRVTDEMFAVAARTLAKLVTQDDLAMGRIYPALTMIRTVSQHIGAAVAEVAYANGLATVERPADLLAYVGSVMYDPIYPQLA